MIIFSATEYQTIIGLTKAVDEKVWINILKSENVIGNFNNYYQTNIVR